MTTNTLLPKVGMSGLFNAIAPYDKLINPMLEYRCVSVTNINALIAAGQDPLTDVYLFSEDSEDNYNEDVSVGRALVTLQAGAGELVVVPSHKLVGLPVTDGVRYVNTYLGISLSAIAESTDLNTLSAELTQLVYEHLGVRPEIQAAVIGAPVIVSHEDHKRILQARTITTQSELSLRAKCEVLENTNTKLKQQLELLETYIKNNVLQK